jgi:hypothetical protein
MVYERVEGMFAGRLPWMLDFSIWYAWHAKHNTLPSAWATANQADIGGYLGATGWMPIKAWKVSLDGVAVNTEEEGDEKVIQYKVGSRTLTASWTLGPDGDWWQMEHLIASPADFKAALELAEARTYQVDETLITGSVKPGTNGIIAIELPRRPLSDLLHDYLGWGEGLLMMADHEKEVDQLLNILDGKLQTIAEELSFLPGDVLLSPDNLDGQYISPDLFDRYLSRSYRSTSQTAHQAGKSLIVHVGGPMKRILSKLAESGIDAVEGVSGAPQSDVPLPEARLQAGPELTLWGGIPQDWLLETTPVEDFKAGVERVIGEILNDGNTILGIADRVPVAAEVDRLEMMGELIQGI